MKADFCELFKSYDVTVLHLVRVVNSYLLNGFDLCENKIIIVVI